MSPSLRRNIHNVPLCDDDVQMIRHILELVSETAKAREMGDQASVEIGEIGDSDGSDEEEEGGEDMNSYNSSESESENDSEDNGDSDYVDPRSDNDTI